ncbi:hypothetical protein PGSY75_0729600 [Plasmodium gaboni]|uniref:COX assembly mitochondrial protein n=1 Tax=Plasmodium gaboni TaxID=647221 RepID=A0A151LQQ6_9APIC|nr:hypothetical protein PGSY75_0729600 [Plasmodium gaboni]KYO01429.1 hypothetical protein PGSY75_0729600 [Plasmodium gaboni]
MRKIWTPIRRTEEQKIIKNNYDEEKKEEFEKSLPKDFIENNRNKRIPYFEIKESTQLRNKCRAEIDEFVECSVGRMWTILKCKDLMISMRKCLKKYENLEYVKFREKQIIEERKKNGTSLYRSDERARYNRFVYTDNEKGWIPEKKY